MHHSLLTSATVLLGIQYVDAKAVFAHFMIANAVGYSASDWATQISLAQQAHIDAFALNIAYDASGNEEQVANAFSAADGTGFGLFFSFDYDGNGAWDQQSVIDYIQNYSSSSAYYQYDSKPFVSTFEGPANADDWTTIKSETNCFFVPDWSSQGASGALALDNGVADGLFNWNAWPWGPQAMNTSSDESYVQALGSKPYMMAVSPWFFTNLPDYSKNWLWNGDDLWYDRWQEVYEIEPEWVEIITWNDIGESHYIGPINSNAFGLFTSGGAPFNYAENMPHDGWRDTLPFSIDLYVDGSATITQELLTVYYRPNPENACATGGTTGNTASQGQEVFAPSNIVEDAVYYSALLAEAPSSVTVTIGGVSQTGSWTNTPSSGVGIYHGSVAFNGNTGLVVVTVTTSAGTMTMTGSQNITTDCTDGIENWNAWVGSATGGTVSATASVS